MNASITFEPTAFDIEDSEDIMGLARSLVNGRHPGVLGTVGMDGIPEVRWMSTLSFDEFPVFYTLTSPDSRKIEQIKSHPGVNWMFFNEDLSLVLNLRGKAEIINDVVELKKIWQKIEDMSHAYFLNNATRKLGFVAIKTTVQSIECNSPKHAFRMTVAPDVLVCGE